MNYEPKYMVVNLDTREVEEYFDLYDNAVEYRKQLSHRRPYRYAVVPNEQHCDQCND